MAVTHRPPKLLHLCEEEYGVEQEDMSGLGIPLLWELSGKEAFIPP